MNCPQCKTGNLLFIQPVELMGEITSLIPFATVESREVEAIPVDEPYIGCDNCDLMGSLNEVVAIVNQEENPDRVYDGYGVTQEWTDGTFETRSSSWALKGCFLSEDQGSNVCSEVISRFSEEKLAFAMLYRITGITGVPGQTYYPVKEFKSVS